MKGCILTLTVGEKLMIDCRVAESGSNPKNVSITLRGTNLTERNVNYNQSYTVVEMVTDEFNGTTYTCEASNGVTEQQIVYTVIVGHSSSKQFIHCVVFITLFIPSCVHALLFSNNSNHSYKYFFSFYLFIT